MSDFLTAVEATGREWFLLDQQFTRTTKTVVDDVLGDFLVVVFIGCIGEQPNDVETRNQRWGEVDLGRERNITDRFEPTAGRVRCSLTPHNGFAKLALMPALEMEILCCSMASCMLERSAVFILSNSSIAAKPKSAKTNAPASNVQRPSAVASLTAAAVKPAAEAD